MGNRRSESWSCYLCEGTCKLLWLLLERVLREDMMRGHKILLQLRTDSYNSGKRSWSHCCFPKSLTCCTTAARKAKKGLWASSGKVLGMPNFKKDVVVSEKVQQRETAAIKGMQGLPHKGRLQLFNE